jgi:DNA-binding CsgD family transcriptional regulator
MLHPAPVLLERHARHHTTHASLIAEILSLLAGSRPASQTAAQPLREPLRESELRVLRYLPTNLQAPEIAHELFVSRNTVKTHMRNLYAKLGTHRRAETVERARALGLLAPSARRNGGNRKSPSALRRSRKRPYADGRPRPIGPAEERRLPHRPHRRVLLGTEQALWRSRSVLSRRRVDRAAAL